MAIAPTTAPTETTEEEEEEGKGKRERILYISQSILLFSSCF
jgi:hypothetical protein